MPVRTHDPWTVCPRPDPTRQCAIEGCVSTPDTIPHYDILFTIPQVDGYPVCRAHYMAWMRARYPDPVIRPEPEGAEK